MGDIALKPDQHGEGEIEIIDGEPVMDDGLETAVYISLFSDRRADDQDELPDNSGDRRGWWADAVEGETPLGSKLWLLVRSKTLPEVLEKAATYAREALQWLKDENIASKIEVTATRSGPSQDWLFLDIKITRPDRTKGEVLRYEYNWKSQELKGVTA